MDKAGMEAACCRLDAPPGWRDDRLVAAVADKPRFLAAAASLLLLFCCDDCEGMEDGGDTCESRDNPLLILGFVAGDLFEDD